MMKPKTKEEWERWLIQREESFKLLKTFKKKESVYCEDCQHILPLTYNDLTLRICGYIPHIQEATQFIYKRLSPKKFEHNPIWSGWCDCINKGRCPWFQKKEK